MWGGELHQFHFTSLPGFIALNHTRFIDILTFAGTRGVVDATLPHKVFRECRQNALSDMAEMWHSFAAILFTPTLKMSWSGQVRSRSYDVIHDVMFGRKRRILRSIVSG